MTAPRPAASFRGALGGGIVVLLGTLAAFGPLSMDLYLPALPSVAGEFAASQAPVQLTLSAAAIGLAAGQLVAGPLSDRYGRRGPLLFGVAAWTLASALCALAPDVWLLVAIRLLQGLGGAAGIVLARAIVRDRLDGLAAAKAFAVLASIAGAAPVLAPVLGAQLLRVTDWRGVFLVLAGIGALVVAAAFRWLPETLPGEHRAAGGLRTTLGNARVLLGRWSFSTAILAQGLGFGALFTYISTSSFVLQSGFGVTAQQFGLAFAANGVGIVLAGQFSRVLVGRLGSGALLRAGLLAQVLAGAALLGAAVAGWGLPVVLPAFFVVAFGAGLLMPNATAMAMAEAGRPMAGTASALVGVVQFAIGAVGAPLAGLGTTGALLPTALAVLGFAVLGSVAALGTARAPRHEPVPVLDGVPGPAA